MVDYQEIISIIAEFMGVALPIGVIFGIAEKIINLFFSLAFGKGRVNM